MLLVFFILYLIQVKRVLYQMVYAVYHSRLETAFLKDEFALPPVASSLEESPPNSPPSPLTLVQTPGKLERQDTGTIQEVIKAVRIEQAMKIKSAQPVDENLINDDAAATATPPVNKSRWATVQKLLMGKGKDDGDRSGSSSAAGSRRGSDGNSECIPAGVVEKGKGNDGKVGDNIPGGGASHDGKEECDMGDFVDVSSELENVPIETKDAVEEFTKSDDESSNGAAIAPSAATCTIAQESDMGNENEQERRASSDHGHRHQIMDRHARDCAEIKVFTSQVEKMTGRQEEEQVFSFDATDNDSEAEDAMETLDESDNETVAAGLQGAVRNWRKG